MQAGNKFLWYSGAFVTQIIEKSMSKQLKQNSVAEKFNIMIML